MKIIDSHTHIYPEKIVEKATQSISQFYNLKMDCLGSVSHLLDSGRATNITKYVVHSVAVQPKLVENINNFILAEVQSHPEFIGYMTMHPGLEKIAMRNEIERTLDLGLKGLKMHPDIQQFNIDCDEAIEIYKAIRGRTPILLHTGDDRYDYSSPLRLAKVAKMFPNTIFIGAHFGGYRQWDKLSCFLDTPNVYFDTSSTLMFMDTEYADSLISKLGSHRFFFGTDFPVTNHIDELARLNKLKLTSTQQEDILYNNYAAMMDKLHISI